MSDSVAPVSFQSGTGNGEESRPDLRWMSVVKGSEAVPLELRKVETDSAKAAREERDRVDDAQGASESSGAMLEGEPDTDAGAVGEADPGSCAQCDTRREELATFEHAYLAAVRDMVTDACSQSHALEGALIELSLEVARVLAEGMTEIDPDLHLELARSALRELNSGTEFGGDASGGDAGESGASGIRLRVGERGFELLQGQLDEKGCLDGVSVDLVRDATLPSVGCFLESTHGRVDGTLDTRLEQVRQALMTTWKAYGVEPTGAAMLKASEPPAETEPEPEQ